MLHHILFKFFLLHADLNYLNHYSTMAGLGRGCSRVRQQAPLNYTHLYFSILHDESEDLDETQLSESTEQASAQPEPAQPEAMAP